MTTQKKTRILGIWGVLLCGAWMQNSHFPPWVSFHAELLAFFAFAGLFALVLIELAESHASWDMSGVELSITLVLALVVLQAALDIKDYRGDTVVIVLYLIAMVFAVSAGRQMGDYSSAIESLAWTIVSAGVCGTTIALIQSIHFEYQFAFINPMPHWRRPGANLAQPNHLGTLLLWAVASGLYLQTLKRMSHALTGLLCVFFLIGLAATESRTALLGALAIAVFWVRLPSETRMPYRYFMSACLAGLGALFFFQWPIFITGIQEGGWSSAALLGGQVNTQVGTRFLVWPQLVAAILERPLMGWGLQNVSVALNAVLDRYTSSEPFTYAHNLILELAIGFGIPMTMLLLGSAAFWSVRRVKQLRNSGDWYAIALLVPFFLHSLLEFPFAYAYFLLPACFAIGMLDAGRLNTLIVRMPRKAAYGVLMAWFLVGAWAVHDYFLAEEDFRVARFEALKMGHTPKEYVRPNLLLLNQLDALNAAARLVPTPNMQEDALNAMRKAAQRYPSTAIQNRYALALALNGNVKEARRQLKVIRVMHGERTYAAIRDQWLDLAIKKYPHLKEVLLVR